MITCALTSIFAGIFDIKHYFHLTVCFAFGFYGFIKLSWCLVSSCPTYLDIIR